MTNNSVDKKAYLLKLIPPRPSFAQDMNEQERMIMQQHVVYRRALIDQGKTLVYGPVVDPGGVYGLGVVLVESDEELNDMIANDPAAPSGLNHYESFPMRAVYPGMPVKS